MKTIHSLSGGKTSSFMAVHYPADINLFSLVKIDDHKSSPKDKALIQKVSDKLGSDFIATAEDDLTLKAMFDLEQLMGREIYWVSGSSFDNVVKYRGCFLPNKLTRYCTTEMKLRHIWDWWYANIGEKIRMGIGYRYDEKERAERFTTSFKGIVGKRGTRNKWEELEWREGWFPLIEDRVTYPRIIKWANDSGIVFPSDSNCVGCFHKPYQQLRKNWEDNNDKMQWFADLETQSKGTWKDGINYEQIKKIGLQQDFDFGTGSGCQAGFCTD
jgi:hypothetical protein